MFDERTEHLNLPLPNMANPLNIDVDRLRETIVQLDQSLFDLINGVGAAGGQATLDADGKVPAAQLPETLATGVMMDYALKTLPSSAWRFCDGSALLDTDTPASSLRAKLIADGNVYGDDGNGNPLLPDARGRVTAGKDDMGGTAANRLTAIDGKTIGKSGGADTHQLTTAQLAKHGHTLTDPGHNHAITDPGHAHSIYDPGHQHAIGASFIGSGASSNGGYVVSGGNVATTAAATGIGIYANTTGISIQAKATGITIADAGAGEAHNNVQPTLVVNKIIKL